MMSFSPFRRTYTTWDVSRSEARIHSSLAPRSVVLPPTMLAASSTTSQHDSMQEPKPLKYGVGIELDPTSLVRGAPLQLPATAHGAAASIPLLRLLSRHAAAAQVVRSLATGCAAEACGKIRAGDVLVAVDGEGVQSWGAAKEALRGECVSSPLPRGASALLLPHCHVCWSALTRTAICAGRAPSALSRWLAR